MAARIDAADARSGSKSVCVVSIARTLRLAVAVLFAGTALALLASRVLAQTAPSRTVTGTVRDTSGVPIPFVNIDGPKNLRALSDEEGHFRLVLPTNDAVSLTLRRLGFNALTLKLPAGADTSLNLHMDVVPMQLNAVRVVTQAIQALRNRGFYARMAEREQGINTGQFITPEEIELRHASRPTQLFDARLGVKVQRAGKCNVIVKCWVLTGPHSCVMEVYLDGQRLMAEDNTYKWYYGSGIKGANEANSVFLDAVISAGSIAGIEIYQRGASAPPQYQTLNSMCGVVLIWTK